MRIPKWTWIVLALAVVYMVMNQSAGAVSGGCPGSQVSCPGVGCVSGPDKCVPGNKGGPSAVFSKEGFEVMKPKAWDSDWAKFTPPAFLSWPGVGVGSAPPEYGKENFVSKSCPGGYRSDGPCLMDFPGF
jgi:hypothetical protein